MHVLTGHPDWVLTCGFSPDAGRIVSASAGLRLWHAATGQCQRLLKGHTRMVTACGFSPDSRRLVSTSFDGTARVWDTASGQALHVLAGRTNLVVDSELSPDGRRAVTGSWAGPLPSGPYPDGSDRARARPWTNAPGVTSITRSVWLPDRESGSEPDDLVGAAAPSD